MVGQDNITGAFTNGQWSQEPSYNGSMFLCAGTGTVPILVKVCCQHTVIMLILSFEQVTVRPNPQFAVSIKPCYICYPDTEFDQITEL
jgi:hypothetical protein